MDVFTKISKTEQDTLKDRYLTFALGDEVYGIEVKYVTEIIGIQAITEIPDFPDFVKGIINLRGKVIPVMDLRLRFRKEPKEYNERTCIVVAELNQLTMGIIVDSVAEVMTIPEQDVVSPPQMSLHSEANFLRKIGKIQNSIILLLDCESLLRSTNL